MAEEHLVGQCEPWPKAGKWKVLANGNCPLVQTQKHWVKNGRKKKEKQPKMNKSQKHNSEFQRVPLSCRKYTYQMTAVMLKFFNVIFCRQAHVSQV